MIGTVNRVSPGDDRLAGSQDYDIGLFKVPWRDQGCSRKILPDVLALNWADSSYCHDHFPFVTLIQEIVSPAVYMIGSIQANVKYIFRDRSALSIDTGRACVRHMRAYVYAIRYSGTYQYGCSMAAYLPSKQVLTYDTYSAKCQHGYELHT
jgi:hypothetical protein